MVISKKNTHPGKGHRKLKKKKNCQNKMMEHGFILHRKM
jgi:hypothetical protein